MACPCKDELGLYPITIGNIDPEAEPYRDCIEKAFCFLGCVLRNTPDSPVVLSDGSITSGLVIDINYVPEFENAIASAAPTEVRNNGWQSAKGFINIHDFFFSKENFCEDIIVHEALHVLTLPAWQANTSGAFWTGTNANSQFQTLGGVGQVPLQSSTNRHWSQAALKNEVLTPFISNSTMPFSSITIGALDDIGYTVDYAKSDTYFVQQIIDEITSINSTSTFIYSPPPELAIKVELCDSTIAGQEIRSLGINEWLWSIDNESGLVSQQGLDDLDVVLVSNPGCIPYFDFTAIGYNFDRSQFSNSNSPGSSCSVRFETFYQGQSIGLTDVVYEFCAFDDPLVDLCDKSDTPVPTAPDATIEVEPSPTARPLPGSGGTVCFIDEPVGVENIGNGTFVVNNNISLPTSFNFIRYNQCGEGEVSLVNLVEPANCVDFTPGVNSNYYYQATAGLTTSLVIFNSVSGSFDDVDLSSAYISNHPGLNVNYVGVNSFGTNFTYEATGVSPGFYNLEFVITDNTPGCGTSKTVAVIVEVGEPVSICPEWSSTVAPGSLTVMEGDSGTFTITNNVVNNPTIDPPPFTYTANAPAGVTVTNNNNGTFVVSSSVPGSYQVQFTVTDPCDGDTFLVSSTFVVEADDPGPSGGVEACHSIG